MKCIVLPALVALAASATIASAADLPRRSAPQVYTAPVPMFTWTGFYVGVNAGGIWGDFTKNASGINPKTGFTGGAQLGYNYQIGSFVAGVEADYNYADLSGRQFIGTGVQRGKLDSFGTIRGRLGLAFDRAMIYGTGGYAFGSNEIRVNGTKDDKYHNGYAVGAGLEYAFTNNISAKAEYMFMGFEEKRYFGGPGKAGIDASLVRGGINYRF
jgi:outer membrane immunogenic protein